ncbi:hypothetical protein HKX48_003749 [Thoreauomyces humboldtii]|nr:hypothetical protein HKX48_003749 [Thoreauomyces humboldtii]
MFPFLPDAVPSPSKDILHLFESKVCPGKTMPLERYLQQYDLIPGCSIAAVNGGEIQWVKSYGVRQADAGKEDGGLKPVDAFTQFQAASVSKPVTAVAVGRLVDQGLLDLDADVNVYLKRWKVEPPVGVVVTLRLLLSHRAGLSVSAFSGYARNNEASRARIPNLVGVLNGDGNSVPVGVDSVPGFERYSGGGYAVVQCIMEDVCGKPFHEIMDELILTPCGMTHSTFKLADVAPPSDNYASGHPFSHASISGKYMAYPESSAAGLWTTALDMSRFGLVLGKAVRPVVEGAAQDRNDSGRGDLLLSQAIVRELITIPGVELNAETDKNPAKKRMTLGFNRCGYDSSLRLSHGGGNLGFTCVFEICPAGGFGFVVFLNGHDEGGLFGQIRGALQEIYGWTPVAPLKEKEYKSEEEAGKYVDFATIAGTYRAANGDGTLVMQVDGTCSFPPFANGPFGLERVEENKFALIGFPSKAPEGTSLELRMDEKTHKCLGVDMEGPGDDGDAVSFDRVADEVPRE